MQNNEFWCFADNTDKSFISEIDMRLKLVKLICAVKCAKIDFEYLTDMNTIII